ncbi:Gfo/Idh/MocA family protein [Sporosarcina pasteurii]|uniref:1,5-anhydro-D-fructose reductase n=1 Tax=Sporosarcina pasteurii TaxID=1474 RepID=A0A380BDC5_SPOPA|nr:Gfo/Idh/MocA family oxidoreductase [Sporosarcina pasteurii]MDS9472502.1 Gfo/Idh/MocA family oxidoreductase [Sporosarcina pasteurii]QBQ06056.1 Gfo/Idh/MocA family oxidoreductase [Sporosarcina pasteurii]SUI99610.1 1,5-anhydro-D-fructose reductase [Sporosarcina pasteurii]
MTEKKVRWGIIGTASIGKRSVIPGIQESDRNIVKAVASRHLDSAQKYADELGIPKAYGSYEELLADPDIDAVYIPLPNHLHKKWTIKAAKAGKHVLCEKPMALNEQEALEMIEACEEAGVIFVEAYMYLHQQRYEAIKHAIHNGEIGEVRGIHGVFTFDGAEDKGNIRFTKEWGGGSIYDVGCYPISAARYLLNEEPTAVTTHAFFSPEHGNVDMMASGIMEFSNGVALTFDCGMWAEFRNELEILGTKGRIIMGSAFIGDQSYRIIKDGKTNEIHDENINPYKLQADHFAESVLDGKPVKFSSDDMVNNIKAIKGALTSAEKQERIIL